MIRYPWHKQRAIRNRGFRIASCARCLRERSQEPIDVEASCYQVRRKSPRGVAHLTVDVLRLRIAYNVRPETGYDPDRDYWRDAETIHDRKRPPDHFRYHPA
jgi:hypothetical protein